MKIGGTTTLLTGASGGLGHAIAREMARRGSKLVLTGRRREVLASLAAETGGEAVTCDLQDRAQVSELTAKYSGVDIFIANAGLPGAGNYRNLTDEDVDRLLEVNLRAPVVMAHGLVREMVQRGRGHIVFISSLSGIVASPDNSLYAMTKFGLRGFAHAFRMDAADAGVGVSVVLPGFVSDAGMFADAGVPLPPGVRAVSPEVVAKDVADAIEKNRAEVVSAPLELAIGAHLGAISPRLAALAQRSGLARRTSAALADRQRERH